MKVYISARFYKTAQVRKIYQILLKKGHQISADWTLHKPIKPYEENSKLAAVYSVEDINGSIDCDIFILLGSEDGGTGMYIELGAAIASNLKKGKPDIYVVDNNFSRSMFYFHPSVKRRQDVEEVLAEM